MRFQLDHDWQGNMSTPRARIGENAKSQLLILLSIIWIFLGLIGHTPWKPLETSSISIVKDILDNGHLIAPLAANQTFIDLPPLYHLTAAGSARLFSPLLDMHDGARLINALWMSITLLMVGMAGRELWTRGVGRYATFIMIGTIGLILNAHSLNAEVATLASTATGFYAFALSKRRPWRASALLGVAMAIGFLSKGLLPVLILTSTTLLLGLTFSNWRTKSFATFFITALLVATPLVALWLVPFALYFPDLFNAWLDAEFNSFSHDHYFYFFKILIWYAWPALPLALWSLWRYRAQLLSKPKFQLTITFFICSLIALGACADNKDINALTLLLPLVALGAGSVDYLKRGAASALNWFGISLFALAGSLIWLGWFAMVVGYPSKLQERMQFLSGANNANLDIISLALALIITSIWIFTCIRARQSNRAAVTNWAVGMTFGWGLLMTLWLPWIDSAKSYMPVFKSMQRSIPSNTSCINSLNVGQSQRLLLHYYTNLQLESIGSIQSAHCDFYLIQDERGLTRMQPGDEWRLLWQGKRAADRKESFRLYQRQP
jgi:4-amino-4-deoxy-L-arabinose transferase-like glycosyltransferase